MRFKQPPLPHIRDGEVCRACAIAKFTKGDWGRSKDMVFPIKGGGHGDSSLTQTSTPEEGAGGNCPDGSVEGVREVDTAVQSCKMLNGYWSTIPRCMIDEVPAADAGHPCSDGTTSLAAFMLTNESTEKQLWALLGA